MTAFAAQSPSSASDKQIFIPSYNPDELKNVRTWEKTWAGQKIDNTNVQQIKDFLLGPQINLLSKPELMREEHYWFEIVSYREAIYSRGQLEMTRSYAPSAKLDGDMLANYANIAGFPFPWPVSGIEAAYNFDMQTRGDSRNDVFVGYTVEPDTGIAKKNSKRQTDMFWTGRTYANPYPRFSPNPKGYRRTIFTKMLEPPAMADAGILEIRYNDFEREDDEWFWMPQYRRIRRISRAQSGQNVRGTEQLREDKDGWFTHINRNNYQLLGRKELLLVRHQDVSSIRWTKGSGVYNGLQRERIKTFEIEAVPKDSSYTYSRQLWYLDPEQWHILVKLCWDRNDNLWRCNENFYQKSTTVNGEYAYCSAGTMNLNVMTPHASIGIVTEVKNVSKNFPSKIFSINSLQKMAY